MQTRLSVLENQAHILNFKRHKILNESGIRRIILRRNKLNEKFALSLQKTLAQDKYLKMIDLAGNKLKEHALKVILKKGMLENPSVVCIDTRLNFGMNEKLQRQFALVMLKNIESMRAKGITIKKEWLVPDLYSFQIPPGILKGLHLKCPGELLQSRRTKTTKQGEIDTMSHEEGGMNMDFCGQISTLDNLGNLGQEPEDVY